MKFWFESKSIWAGVLGLLTFAGSLVYQAAQTGALPADWPPYVTGIILAVGQIILRLNTYTGIR